MKFGLVPNSDLNKTEEGGIWTIENTYGERPIFLARDNSFKQPGDVTLEVDVDDSKMLPDFPSLIDNGANLEDYAGEMVVWWEDWPSELDDLLSDEEREEGISVNDPSFYRYFIDMTKTAATFQSINPNQIKIIKESSLMLEFGRSDLQVVVGDADNFTIAYEIELEEIPGINNDDMDRNYADMFASLERGDYDEEEFEDFYSNYEDEDEYSNSNYDNGYDSYRDVDDESDFLGNDPDMNLAGKYFPFTEDEIHEKFYQFFNKWGGSVNIKPDITLDKGFEIVPNTYFSSINESFDFVDDFFKNYYKQDRFELNDNTGWHINIGYKDKNLSNLNLLKGAILLSDEFATKDFAQRMKSEYAKPVRDVVLKSIKDAYDYEVAGENLMMRVFAKNIDKIENVGNEFLTTAGLTSKEFGFNPRKGYVEFRYPGGRLTPQQIKQSTLYYCYIIKAVVDPEFKRKEYIKKLYKLLFGE